MVGQVQPNDPPSLTSSTKRRPRNTHPPPARELRFEKSLNVIDHLDTQSKLLVTTRIRDLIKGAAEVDVGTLSADESLELLAATAGIEMASLEADEEAHALASTVTDLCG